MNAVLPGSVETNMTRGLFDEGSPAAEKAEEWPAARFAEAHEIAPIALFLASDEASYVIGASSVVDGGWSAL